MKKILWLFGLLPETVELIREMVTAIRAGDRKEAREKAERAAIVQAFRVHQSAKRKFKQ